MARGGGRGEAPAPEQPSPPTADVGGEAGGEEDWRSRARRLAQKLERHHLERAPEAQLILAMALVPPLCGHLPCGKFDWSPPRMLVNLMSSPLCVAFFSLLNRGPEDDRCEFCLLSRDAAALPPCHGSVFALRCSAAGRGDPVYLPADVVMLVDACIGPDDVMMRFMDETTPLKRPEQLSLERDYFPLARVLKPLPEPSAAPLERALAGPGLAAAGQAAGPPSPTAEEEDEREAAARRKRPAAPRSKKQKDAAEAPSPPAAALAPAAPAAEAAAGREDGEASSGREAAEPVATAIRSAEAGATTAGAAGRAAPGAASGRCHIQLRPVGRRFSFRPLSSVTIHVQ